MTGQQLKNSILQMAVQGKLVPQDPNDEPASVLLERIRAEKEQLVREGKIKREKNPSVIFRGADNLPYEKIGNGEPVCIADEVPFEIPESWEWVRLGSVIVLQSGQDLTPDKYNADGKGIPYIIGASNIVDGKVLINRWTEYGRAFALKGEILLTCKGTVGTMAILREEKVHIARQIMAIHPADRLYISYIQLVLETLVVNLKAAAKSMIPGISREDVLTSLLPVPPLAEQYRIVEKYSAIAPFLHSYTTKEKLLNCMNVSFPTQLKKSILQWAVQGKLVPQDPNDEPASVLLERIRAEKEQLIREGKIKRDKHESVIFRRDNSYYEKVDGIECCIDDEVPFDVPESWEWCRLSVVSLNIHYGYTASASPTGNAKLLRITDIQEGMVCWESVPFCTVTDVEFQKYGLNNRDIIIARTGGTVGKSYIVAGLHEHSVFASYLIRVIPSVMIDESYIRLFMDTPLYWNQLKAASMGTGQPNVNGQALSSLLIPIPPLNEQKRIVDKIKVVDNCVRL